MKKKRLVLDLAIISAAYFLGAYFLYQKVGARINISGRDLFTYGGLVVAIWVLFLVFTGYHFSCFEKQLQIKTEHEQDSIRRLDHAYQGTIKALISALDCRDHATWVHSARVVGYALAIADQMGLDEKEQHKLALAGFLHDIGKIGVPDHILLKKSRLLPEEWAAIKRHPEIGYEIIQQLDFFKNAADIILLHHEHYDGGGYPFGLRGEEIPLNARIFAVADALDAITSDRPYRPARSMEFAIQEICSLSGEQFCPLCTQCIEKLGLEYLTQIEQEVKKQGQLKFQLEEFVCCGVRS
jgi:putative nucleotidyltransferase with HDIG domain